VKLHAKVSHKREGRDRLMARLKAARGLAVQVGVVGGEPREDQGPTNVELAIYHEFGTSTLPARPFLRPALLEKREQHVKFLQTALGQVVSGGKDLHEMLEALGLKAAADVRHFVQAGKVRPKSSDETNRRKGSTKTLIDTGQLVNAIDSRVVNLT
jgi:HK97 gp10 family phage protein